MKKRSKVDFSEVKKEELEQKILAKDLEEELSDEAEFAKLKRNLDKSYGTFYPQTFQMQIWDFISYLVICYQVIVIPYLLGFSLTDSDSDTIGTLKDIEIFCEVFFLTDTLMRFNLGYFDNGFLVMQRKKIVKNYLKNDFGFNIFTSIPITLLQRWIKVNPYAAAFFQLAKILRVEKIKELF